ncbi:MAG: glycosyltransferase [Verrucomicrobiota bacterium]|jgi:glycosyltransferase involved in cell wall biosynthesis
MNVLQIISYYHPEHKFGGPPLKVHSLSKGLAGRGHSVKVLTFDSSRRQRRDAVTYEGVEVQYLPWMGWGLRQWPRERELIAGAVARSDIVHCYGLYNALCPVAGKIAGEGNRPFLIEPLGMYEPKARNRWLKSVYNHWVTRRIFRRAAGVVAASAAEREELKGAVPDTKLYLRRNGIDVEAFRHLPSGAEFRRKLGMSEGEGIILFLGRISPVKNLEGLVRAFGQAGLKERTLVLAGPEGEPDYSAKLRETIRELNLDGKVIFAGALFDAEKLAALAAAEVFVMPSLSESFGNAAAEAVAAGVPVLLTETCGVAPMIHERAGMAVPLGTEALAGGLRAMMDAEQRAVLTRRRDEVMRELSWEEPLNQTERIYAKICKDHDKKELE